MITLAMNQALWIGFVIFGAGVVVGWILTLKDNPPTRNDFDVVG